MQHVVLVHFGKWLLRMQQAFDSIDVTNPS